MIKMKDRIPDQDHEIKNAVVEKCIPTQDRTQGGIRKVGVARGHIVHQGPGSESTVDQKAVPDLNLVLNHVARRGEKEKAGHGSILTVQTVVVDRLRIRTRNIQVMTPMCRIHQRTGQISV